MPNIQNGSAQIDERIVQLSIDNKQFEKGAKTTLSTLEKLDRALKIKSDSKAIDDISKSIANFDASPMADNLIDNFESASNAVDKKAEFIRQTIRNISNDVYNFAKKTVKELVIDMPSQGMDKYNQLAETTQMLVAATRDNPLFAGLEGPEKEVAQMEYINGQLERLMWFSDETSYNFNELASTAGKFMNVLGNDANIEDVFTMMMGIASLGAASGSDANTVNNVMRYSFA